MTTKKSDPRENQSKTNKGAEEKRDMIAEGAVKQAGSLCLGMRRSSNWREEKAVHASLGDVERGKGHDEGGGTIQGRNIKGGYQKFRSRKRKTHAKTTGKSRKKKVQGQHTKYKKMRRLERPEK